ncbi:MAG: cyanophycin synthetase [Lautropia sp.]
MELTRIRALRGPNLWTRHTAIEALVHCPPAECETELIAGFETRLRERLPQIGEWRATGSTEPVPMAAILEAAALALQTSAGCPVTFSRTRATGQAGVFQVIVEYSEEPVGRRAIALAHELCVAAVEGRPFNATDAIAELADLDEDIRLGPSTGSIVDAAIARDIPFRRLTEGSLVHLGWGAKGRRIQAAEVDVTSAIAEQIAQDKELTKETLEVAGVPVPGGFSVRSVEAAWEAMQTLGGRVVVKPQDGNQGKGVTVNIATREQLEQAFAAAEAISSDVLVERFISGHDFRLLVVGDKLVAAARRDPPFVTGDGARTVQQLVDEVNRDPRRGSGHATSLTRIRLDEIAKARLALQGLTIDSIPAQGVRVVLRNNANLSTGGTATDVTDDVHPEVAARAVEAAQAVGVHICGVDAVCRTVFAPLEEQGGGIVEVNAAPGLRMHLTPSFGKGRNVGEAVIASMFPPGEDGRIPIVAVTGTNGKTTTAKLIARILETSGKLVGTTGTDGIFVGRRQLDDGDCSGPKSARSVLLHPDTEAAVFETARGGILREGLGFDCCTVAVVTNIGSGDHLGLNFIDTVEDLAAVKRVIVQNVSRHGYAVLNGDDPHTTAMAAACPGSVIFFGRNGEHGATGLHRAQGGRAVFRRGDAIVCAHGADETEIALAEVPLTHGGRIPFQVENTMAAVAAAWALDIGWDTIRTALAGFVSDTGTAPGRFNLMSYRGATVIADYGHNPDAIEALVDAVKAMPAKRRSVVISGAGDRRDEDLVRQTEILGAAFEDVVLYQDQAQRGRADGEVLALLRRGLVNASRTKYSVEIRGEFLAIDHALERLKPGELCLVLVDQVDEALAHLKRRIDEADDAKATRAEPDTLGAAR